MGIDQLVTTRVLLEAFSLPFPSLPPSRLLQLSISLEKLILLLLLAPASDEGIVTSGGPVTDSRDTLNMKIKREDTMLSGKFTTFNRTRTA